ncbi:A-kinase anchor protein 12-like [Polyodon spathula]|uniref:A-kinase anchor protein 12-like n=1 Tax=Polyodon spathula TaxID=7913 RepID=UPI001B7DB111|nr:A-kinase anchor protein 12-like [Polyodon spathula]
MAAIAQWEDPTGGENTEPPTQDKMADKLPECRAETKVPSPAAESQHTTETSGRPKPSATATQRIWGQFWKGSGFSKANGKKKREGSEPDRSGPDGREIQTASTAEQVESRQSAPPGSAATELGSPMSHLSLEVEAGPGAQPMENRAGTEEVTKGDSKPPQKDTRPRHIEKSSSVRDFIRRPVSNIFLYKSKEKKEVGRKAVMGVGLSTSLDRLSEKETCAAIETCELENNPGQPRKRLGLVHTRRWHSFKKIVAPKTRKKSLDEPRDDEGDPDRHKPPKFKDSVSRGDPENKGCKKRKIKRSWTYQVIRKDHSFAASNKTPSWPEDPVAVKEDRTEQVETDCDNQLAFDEEDAVEGDGMHRDTERKASPSKENTKSRDQQAREVWKSFKKLVTPKSKRTTEATETEESHITEGQVSPDKSSRQQAVPKKARYSRATSLKNIILRKSKSRSTDLEEAATGTAPIGNLPEQEKKQSCKKETANARAGEIEVDSSGDLSDPQGGLSDAEKHSVTEQVSDAGKEQKQSATVQSDIADKAQDTTESNADRGGKPESDQSLGCNLPNSGADSSHETNKETKVNFNGGAIKETPHPESIKAAEKETAQNNTGGALDQSLDLKDNGNETAAAADDGNENLATSPALVDLGFSEDPVKNAGKELPPCERTQVLCAGCRWGESTPDEPSSHQQPPLKLPQSVPKGVTVNVKESTVKQTPAAPRSISEKRLNAPTNPLEVSQKAGGGSSEEMTLNLEDNGRSPCETDSVGAPAKNNAEKIPSAETARTEGIGSSSTEIFHEVCSSDATAETKAEKNLQEGDGLDDVQDSPHPSVENLRITTSSEAETTDTDALGFHGAGSGPNIETSTAETQCGSGSPSSMDNLHINPEEEEMKLFYDAAAAIVRTVVSAATEQISKEQDTLEQDTLDNSFKGSYSNNSKDDDSTGYPGMNLSHCH